MGKKNGGRCIILVMLEYNFLGIVLATLSIAGFMLLYRKTDELPFLLLGAIVYLKLLFSTFNLLSEFVFVIPEFLLTAWLSILTFKLQTKWIILLILFLPLFYVICISYDFFVQYGLPGFVFMLICTLWYNRKKNSL